MEFMSMVQRQKKIAYIFGLRCGYEADCTKNYKISTFKKLFSLAVFFLFISALYISVKICMD